MHLSLSHIVLNTYFNSLAMNHFREMTDRYSRQGGQKQEKQVDFVEYVFNKELEEKFISKKNEFKGKGIPNREVRAFHGTDPKNIQSILKNNLDPSRAVQHGRVHGQGCYFSEFPDFSLRYGKGLMLFRFYTLYY